MASDGWEMLNQESGVEDVLYYCICMYFALQVHKSPYPLGCLGQCHVSQLPASSRLSLLKGKGAIRHCFLGGVRSAVILPDGYTRNGGCFVSQKPCLPRSLDRGEGECLCRRRIHNLQVRVTSLKQRKEGAIRRRSQNTSTCSASGRIGSAHANPS